jgi:putative spermidine/putrescine transport system substrate-binding protein
MSCRGQNHNNSEISRRTLVKATAALTATSIAAPFVSRNAGAQEMKKELVFACNGGSTQTIFEKTILPVFTEQTGIKVTYVPGQPADIAAKLRAQRGTSGLDIVWLGGAVTYTAIDDGLLQPIDLSLVPNAAKMDPRIPREETILSSAVSGNAMIYSKKVFDANKWAPPTTWFDLWEPRFKGHAGMYGMSVTSGVEMLLEVAKELTGDYNNLDPAFEKFKELGPNIYEFFPTAGAWETALQQGDLWLGVNNYTRAIQLTQAGQPIGTVLPKSGMPCHDLTQAVPVGSSNPKGAHAFINFILSTETQTMIAKNLGYSPCITGVPIPDELKAFYPDPSIVWFPDWRAVGKRFNDIVAKWQRIVER